MRSRRSGAPARPAPALTVEALTAFGYEDITHDDLLFVRQRQGFEAALGYLSKRYAEGTASGEFPQIRNVREMIGGVFMLFLHYRPDGISLATMRDLCGAADIHKAMAWGLLTYFRYLGYIEPLPKGADRRQQMFAPTTSMVDAFRLRFRTELELTAAVDPDIAAAHRRFDEPGMFERFIDGLGVMFLKAGKGDEFYDEPLRGFTHRNGGVALLYNLLDAADDDGRAPPMGPIAYQVAALARVSRMSRMNVIRIIRQGEDSGFFERLGEHELRTTPALREAMHSFYAAQVCCYAACARWALQGAG